jgi:peptidoglycan/xylan/chitin deacetylase (PgdA/CDA1 family)
LRRASPASELLIFTFHSLFESKREVDHGLLDPQQGITVAMFRDFVADFCHHGYRFVSPGEIIAGLHQPGPYALISFDDGYANNLRALPVLEEFAAPAVFCVSANHVVTGKPFWWDVLYREAAKRRWPGKQLERMRIALKRLRTEDAEALIVAEFGGGQSRKTAFDTPASDTRGFGAGAFGTACDLDRPFTPAELRGLARHPLVHIGNHTWDHAILSNYSAPEVRQQIERAQQSLAELTGRVPEIIAYPNGNVSTEIEAAVRECGIQLGLTVRPGNNAIPRALRTMPNLHLRRHALRGDRDIATQCSIARSAVSLQAAMSVAISAIRSAVMAQALCQ